MINSDSMMFGIIATWLFVTSTLTRVSGAADEVSPSGQEPLRHGKSKCNFRALFNTSAQSFFQRPEFLNSYFIFISYTVFTGSRYEL